MARSKYEDSLQEQVMLLCSRHIPDDPRWKYIYHIPNGGARNEIIGAQLKRMGVKAGVPDLHWPIARHGFHGLYMELKWGRNDARDTQIDWLQFLSNEGHCCVIVHDDAYEAERVFEWYLNGKGDYQTWKQQFVQWEEIRG